MTNRPASIRFPQNRKCQKHAIPFPIMLTTPVFLTPCQETAYEARNGISPARIALANPAPESHLKAIQSHFSPTPSRGNPFPRLRLSPISRVSQERTPECVGTRWESRPSISRGRSGSARRRLDLGRAWIVGLCARLNPGARRVGSCTKSRTRSQHRWKCASNSGSDTNATPVDVSDRP